MHPLWRLVASRSSSSAQTSSFTWKLLLYFSLNFFRRYLHEKEKIEFSAKNSVSSDSFYPRVGSISDKTSNKVIGKVKAFEMHQFFPMLGSLYSVVQWKIRLYVKTGIEHEIPQTSEIDLLPLCRLPNANMCARVGYTNLKWCFNYLPSVIYVYQQEVKVNECVKIRYCNTESKIFM
jgi:hypothetical protein